MALSRLSRLEEQKQTRRLILALGGIVAIIAFVILFGVKALISFSLLVDQIRGSSPAAPAQNQTILLPPTLDPPPSATNTATINVTGKGIADLTVIIYLNGSQYNKITVSEDGNFLVRDVPLAEGSNSISAKHTDDKGKLSDLSNVVSVVYGNKPPKLEITTPEDNAKVSGETNTVNVQGSTDENVTVTINDRFVVIKSDNTFSYDYPLNHGDNILKIVATDAAGNKATIERRVSYQK